MSEFVASNTRWYNADGSLNMSWATALTYDSGDFGDGDELWEAGEDNNNWTYQGMYDGNPVFIDTGSGTVYMIMRVNSDLPDSFDPMDIEAVTVACFLPGTLIASADGQKAVETLRIGDTIANAAGAAVRVKWIGRQKSHPLFAQMSRGLPVRIGAGALGKGLPQRDLYVSPDHAMLVDGCLVHAAAMINGRTIMQMKEWQGDVEYIHIETEAHEIILAEGAATETFVDNEARARFDNAAEFAQLYPDAPPVAELNLPRISYQRQLPKAIASRLEAVADGLLGERSIAA